MRSIGIFVSAIFVDILTKVSKGYALSILWAWFVITKFGAPELNIAEAIGLCLIVDLVLLKQNTHQPDKSIEDRILDQFLMSIVIVPIILSIGYVVKLWI